MPRALPVDRRHTIIDRHHAGTSLPTIARDLALSPWTVRTIWRRYRDRGDAGLVPDYAACGRPGPRHPAALYAAALARRREHAGWGAGLIRLELAERFPGQRLPHEATRRCWFRAAGLARPRRPPPPPDPPRARVPHARWHLDATEHMRLADGSRVRWLAASDEATGALLGAVVFPLRQLDAGRAAGRASGAADLVCALGPAAADAPGQRPPLGRLERPATPGAAGATCRPRWRGGGWGWGSIWSGTGRVTNKATPSSSAATASVRPGLRRNRDAIGPRCRPDRDWAITTQRERYPRCAGQSRLARYPALAARSRPYDPATEAEGWDAQRVWTWLAERVAVRRVDKVGHISLLARPLAVGTPWARQEVTGRLAVADAAPVWVIRDGQGQLVRQHPAPELAPERIRTLAVSARPHRCRATVNPDALRTAPDRRQWVRLSARPECLGKKLSQNR